MNAAPLFAAALAALGLGLRAPQEGWTELRPLEVTVNTVDEVELVTLVATNASIERVLQRLVDTLGWRLDGFSTEQPGTALVTVELHARPLRQVLEYTLGSIGLDYEIQDELLTIVPRESGGIQRLEARALAHYLRASRNYPAHEEAAQARVSQGQIEIRRGNPIGALDHFRALIEDHPLSPLVPDAHLAAGGVLEELGRYEEAHEEYLELSRLPVQDERRRSGRLGMARCQLELANPNFTILMLRQMEKNEPAVDRFESIDRLLLKARALNRADMHVETLEVLDELERLGPDSERALGAMQVRALALEELEYIQPAARAWLAIARHLDGRQRDTAYLRSAELALAAGEPLGVLMVVGELRAAGSTADASSLEFRARLELGLPVPNDAVTLAPEERLTVARADLREGRTAPARAGLENLFGERATLDDALLVQVAVELADLRRSEAASRAQGLEQAARTLADARQHVTPEIAATGLDPIAAEMFEDARDFARAAAAWEGRY